MVDEEKQETNDHSEKLRAIKPTVLSSEMVTGMQKAKSIMNFMEGSRSLDSPTKPSSPTKRVVDNLNILHTCH